MQNNIINKTIDNLKKKLQALANKGQQDSFVYKNLEGALQLAINTKNKYE